MSDDIKYSRKTVKIVKDYAGNPGHAVLLVGARGSGANDLTEVLAEKVLEDASKIGAVEAADADADPSIDAVRRLQNFLKLTTTGHGNIRRAIIIKNLDGYSEEAQNTLLKTSEEPPADSIIIASATNVHSLLPTLRSRFTELKIAPLSKSEAHDLYQSQFDSTEIDQAYELSDGGAELLHDLLTKSEEHSFSIAIEQAKEILTEDTYSRLLRVDGLSKNEVSSLVLLITAMRKVVRASIDHAKDRLSQAQVKKRIDQLEALASADKHLKANAAPKIVLDNLFISV